MLLLIDNFDSFVFNLARYFQRLGQETRVVRNNAVDVDEVCGMKPDALVISPGPCTPDRAGCSLELVRRVHERMPILGVCLGHQVIAQALGGKIIRAAEPMHGRSSLVLHDGRGIFAGLPNPLTACRYHSLVVQQSSLPPELEVSARTNNGTIMAIRHRHLPIVGLQFHPESILTENGYPLLSGFLRLAGVPAQPEIPEISSEYSNSQRYGASRG